MNLIRKKKEDQAVQRKKEGDFKKEPLVKDLDDLYEKKRKKQKRNQRDMKEEFGEDLRWRPRYKKIKEGDLTELQKEFMEANKKRRGILHFLNIFRFFNCSVDSE